MAITYGNVITISLELIFFLKTQSISMAVHKSVYFWLVWTGKSMCNGCFRALHGLTSMLELFPAVKTYLPAFDHYIPSSLQPSFGLLTKQKIHRFWTSHSTDIQMKLVNRFNQALLSSVGTEGA